MVKEISPAFRFWSIAGLLAIANVILFDLVVLRAPETLQVQYTPDDAYYYLQLAGNFTKFGYWTFDSGLSITSGFHLLHAYVLALIYALAHPDMQAFVRCGLALSSGVTLIAIGFAWWLGYKSRDPYRMLSLALIASTPGFLVNSTSIVEWPWVMTLAALYVFVFYEHGGAPRTPAALFVLGLLLGLARSDSGLLPVALLSASLIVRRNEGGRREVTAALAGSAGAIVGATLVLLHNHAFTGELIQSSARMKAYWSQFEGQSLYGSFSLIASVIGIDLKAAAFQRSVLLMGAGLIAGAVLLLLLGKRSGETQLPLSVFRLGTESPRDRTAVLAALLSLGAYVLFYSYGGGLQNWYTANLIAPVFILCTGLGHYLDRRILPAQHFTLLWFSAAALLTIGAGLLASYPIGTDRAPWPHQQATLAAGRYLHDHPLDGRVGAWNAGVVGYYQGGTVVNIDGLVNEEIYPYAVNGTLPLYLKEKGIDYLIDFENMLHPPFSVRGGYDDPAFLGGLAPLMQFDDGSYPEWKFLRLYRIGQ